MESRTSAAGKARLGVEGNNPPPWFRWLPLIGVAMLLVAFVLPVPVTDLKHRVITNFLPEVNRDVLWFAGQWAKLKGWGKFGYVAMPVLGLLFAIGLYLRTALWSSVLTIGASLFGLLVAVFFIVPNIGSGGMVAHLSAWFVLVLAVTFGCVVASIHGRLAHDVARPYRWFALGGAALSAVLAFAPLFHLGDGPSSLAGHVVHGFSVGPDVMVNSMRVAPESASIQSTSRNLGLLNALLWASLTLVAFAGGLALFRGRAFVHWQRAALPAIAALVGALLVLHVGSCLWMQGIVEGEASKLQQQLSGGLETTANERAVLHTLPEYWALHGRLGDLIWIGVKSWLALGGMVLVIGTSLGRAVEDRELIRQGFARLLAPAPGGTAQHASGTPGESRVAGLESELAAIASMQAKGLISAEEGERLRSKVVADAIVTRQPSEEQPAPAATPLSSAETAAATSVEQTLGSPKAADSDADNRGNEQSAVTQKPASKGDNPLVAALACIAVAALGLLAIWGYSRLSVDKLPENGVERQIEYRAPDSYVVKNYGKVLATLPTREVDGAEVPPIRAVEINDAIHVLYQDGTVMRLPK